MLTFVMSKVRRPAVAGLFYPGEAAVLEDDVRALLASAAPPTLEPLAIVVPHAGYVYSGPIAATAYASLRGVAERIRHVVLLGPSHRFPLRGVAVPTVEAFATPLGNIPLDRKAIESLLRLPFVQARDEAHATEHSLEVQLPFLQSVLHDFDLVPVSVGLAESADVAALLRPFLGRAATLIVISSDLSHYEDYQSARSHDRRTADSIRALAFERLHPDDACGCFALGGMLRLAREEGLRVVELDVRNSGDTSGDRSRVVGYGAFAFLAREPARADTRGETAGQG